MNDYIIVILYKKNSSTEIESITVTDREDAAKLFRKYIGRTTVSSYKIGEVYKIK